MVRNSLKEIYKNLSLQAVLIFILLYVLKILPYIYVLWKLYITIILIKVIFFFLGGREKGEWKKNVWKNELIYTINWSTSKSAKTIFWLLKKKKLLFNKKTLIDYFLKILTVIIVGFSLKFIELLFKLINLQISSIKQLKYKRFVVKIKGFFYLLKKNIIRILDDEFIFKF